MSSNHFQNTSRQKFNVDETKDSEFNKLNNLLSEHFGVLLNALSCPIARDYQHLYDRLYTIDDLISRVKRFQKQVELL